MSARPPEPFAPVLHLDECASTNSEAMRLTLGGEPGPFWVSAERQTGGRGRQGRTWVSPAGNLCASLFLRLACEPHTASQLSLVAGLALWDAVTDQPGYVAGGQCLQLKWPNDLLIGSAKCAGILVETSVVQPRQLASVIGFGVNVAAHPEETGRPVTSLSAHGITTDRLRLLADLDAAIGRRLAQWQLGQGFEAIRTEWQARALPPGEPITVNTSGTRISGRYAGLDPEGALLLKEEGGTIRRIAFGEVVDAVG